MFFLLNLKAIKYSNKISCGLHAVVCVLTSDFFFCTASRCEDTDNGGQINFHNLNKCLKQLFVRTQTTAEGLNNSLLQ